MDEKGNMAKLKADDKYRSPNFETAYRTTKLEINEQSGRFNKNF